MAELNAGAWTAIVAAGDRPGGDGLAAHFGEASKALIPVGGQSMLSRVARTLLSSPHVARVVILSQKKEPLIAKPDTQWLANEPRVSFAQSQASLSQSLSRLAGTAAAPWPVMVTTADHPLLTVEMIDAFLRGAEDADLCVGFVERQTMLPRFAENKRTWLRFKGGDYSGANLFAFRGPEVQRALALWTEVEASRKSPRIIFSHFGPWLLLRALTRTISLQNGLKAAGARIGVSAWPVILPFAEAAIDVDKLSDHTLAEAILAGEI